MTAVLPVYARSNAELPQHDESCLFVLYTHTKNACPRPFQLGPVPSDIPHPCQCCCRLQDQALGFADQQVSLWSSSLVCWSLFSILRVTNTPRWRGASILDYQPPLACTLWVFSSQLAWWWGHVIAAPRRCSLLLSAWSLVCARCSTVLSGHVSAVTGVTFTNDKRFLIR